jgi:hypothetical protein
MSWSIGGQIRNPQVWISLVKAFTRKSGLAVARACMRGGMWKTGKSGYLSHRYLLLTRFFRAHNILASFFTSNHGVPTGNPHSNVLVTKSAFTFTRKECSLRRSKWYKMHTFDKQMPQCVGGKYPWILSHDGTWWPYGANNISVRTPRSVALRTPENTVN